MSSYQEHISDHEQQDSDEDSFGRQLDLGSGSSSASSKSHRHEQEDSSIHLQPELVEFLSHHQDELTLDIIKAIHKVVSEWKQAKTGKSFEAYVSYLKSGRGSFHEQELEQLRKETKKAQDQSKLLQNQLKEELSAFDKIRIDNILKNSGGKEYVDKLKSCITTKDATIKSQAVELKQQERDIDNLHERLTRANKMIDEQRKLLQQTQVKLNDFELDRRRNMSQQGSVILGMSPEPSFDAGHGHQIPPPPLVDADEIIRMVNSSNELHLTSANSSQYNGIGLNNSIPPPPQVDVSVDEILSGFSLNGSHYSVNQSYRSS